MNTDGLQSGSTQHTADSLPQALPLPLPLALPPFAAGSGCLSRACVYPHLPLHDK